LTQNVSSSDATTARTKAGEMRRNGTQVLWIGAPSAKWRISMSGVIGGSMKR